MKQLVTLGIIGGSSLLVAAPLSLQWSQKNMPLSLESAEATEASVAGGSGRIHRRTYRRAVYGTAVAYGFPRFRFNVGVDRYRPEYISPPAGASYYLYPFSFVTSYNFR
jgi:hypothetical protein